MIFLAVLSLFLDDDKTENVAILSLFLDDDKTENADVQYK